MKSVQMTGYPLTASQLGIYFDCCAHPESVGYNITSLCYLPDGTDLDRLTDAVGTAVRAHRALCAVIREIDGVPSMVGCDFDVPVERLDVDCAKDAVSSLRRPFDLANGPLFRFLLLHEKSGCDVLFFDIHHLVFDGSSISVLLEDVSAVYGGGVCREEEFSFFDYAAWEAGEDKTEKIAAFRQYFSDKFGGVDCDSRPVPDQVTEQPEGISGYAAQPLDGVSADEVSRFVRENGISENALFLGTFGYAISKFNGTTESFFTTGHTGRGDKRVRSSVGFFVRTLPFLCSFGEDDAPVTLLRAAYEDYYKIKQNDCIPFSEFAAEYGADISISFVYQADLIHAVPFGDGVINYVLSDQGSSISDMEVMVLKEGDGYRIDAYYNKSKYTEDLIGQFLRLYGCAVRGMMTEKTLRDIVLTDAESRAQIERFNQTEKPYESKKTVVTQFCEQAKKTPDALCLVYEDRRFTYREADEVTDRIARYLCAEGLEKGQIVGVLIPRCEYMLLCSLGILKAGGAYLPLDPTYPPERLNLMMRDSEAVMLFTTPELTAIIDDGFTGKRFMTEQIPRLPDTDTALPQTDKDDLFIMLYTSGSTGTPKGVMYAHSNTMVTAAWARDHFELGVGSRVAAYASYGFDANVFDTYATIISGAALYIISDEIRLDLPALQRYYSENGITNSVMTTQVGRQFALMGGSDALRTLSVAGEKLTPLTPPAGFRLYNLYGPTEGSVLATAFRIDKYYRDVPIGKAIDNVKLFVVDPCGRLLPPGAVGELWICGPHVTLGYRNRPDKTAQAYGENPFGSEPGYERVYRTGDVVRFLGDGNLQFIGRRDAQVKVRGFRVELTEIEEVIRRFPGIGDATVAAFDSESGEKFIAAYVVSDGAVDVDALNAFIRAEKPPYMVPAVTMQIDKIPLNQNQKVNKRALPKPERRAVSVVPPKNETQKKIFSLAAQILGHESFGIDTNLFDAGLSSIGTLKLNVALADAFGVSVKLNDLRENDTVEKLEALLGAAGKEEERQILNDYPITKTQEGIFIECSANPGTVTYNIPLLMRLDPAIDPDRLAQAVRAAIDAHPYVKTTLFAAADGSIRARRNDSEPARVDVTNEALPVRVRDLMRPFRLLGDPLYRAEVRRTAHGLYLFLEFHHIISDGTSEAVLLSDIDRAYAGEVLETERYTGFDAALDEEAARKTDRYAAAKAYYDGIFAGCETECLPPKAKESGAVGDGTFTMALTENPDAVLSFCKENNLSANAYFNAVFGYTLSRFAQPNDVVFTTVYNGRSDSRLARSVSMLVKTLPVLVRTEGVGTVSELIRTTQEQLMGSMANDLYPFAEISNAYGIRSDVMFIYQGDQFAFDTLCAKPAEMVPVMENAAKAPIAVTLGVERGTFRLQADYRREFYSERFIRSLADAFDHAVGEFYQKVRLSDVSLLSQKAERMLERFNDTARPFENIPCHLFVERNAEANPEKTAVIAAGKKLTYGELNRGANRMAHVLADLGVTKDSVVGMILDRTVELPMTELAIWKAGGAFLGILPTYPEDRISFCLDDAESPVLITSEKIRAERPALFGKDKAYRSVTVEELLRDPREENPEIDVPPDSLAYCIYTSGSTGNPKGVMIEHCNLTACAQPADRANAEFVGPDSPDVGLALSSITFDMSIIEDMLQLVNNKTVCIATEEEIHNPLLLSRLILENGAEKVVTTPSLLTNYLGIPEFRPALQQMKTVIAGAEAFPASLYTELKKLNPDMKIINGYGPSECTITCCAKLLTGPENITIGGPSANTAFYVADKAGNILPPYACGELIICGKLVGRGYVKLPEKTAAAFFSLRGMPAYHSGDFVRYNADGEIEFFGRIDNQIKLRGFRVELDEIESCMCAFDGVKQSKVIVRSNGSEDYLAGFFTADREIDTGALTAHLKSKLTYYMVPDVLMQLDSMPLTPSGKIDKKALPEVKKASKRSEKRAPKKSLEEYLCDLYKSVLSLDECYADDNFFELGGTSLSASKVTMRLMADDIKVEYGDIFDHPTPQQLADFIESNRKPGKAAEKVTAEEDGRERDEALRCNTAEYAAEVRRESIGDVVLTGACGFLGIHILKELVERREGHIYCLVRRGTHESAEIRLKTLLMYYFDNPYDEWFRSCVSIIEADITDKNLGDILRGVPFDTVINSAACVKHFTKDDILEQINVGGVANLIGICKERNARLIQISTVSVAGVHTDETYAEKLKMFENDLFCIPGMENKYVDSKLRAERKMLDAIRNGLRGKIVRVGNLMGRHSDGEFQVNFTTNMFLSGIRGFAAMGMYPISHMTDPMRFSPVDCTAKAIVLLAGVNDKFTAFNADNRYGFDEMKIVDACCRCGIEIKPTADEDYYAAYHRALADTEMNSALNGLAAYDRPDLHAVETDNTFTANILYRIGFSWPLIDESYLDRVIDSLKALDFFDLSYDDGERIEN